MPLESLVFRLLPTEIAVLELNDCALRHKRQARYQACRLAGSRAVPTGDLRRSPDGWYRRFSTFIFWKLPQSGDDRAATFPLYIFGAPDQGNEDDYSRDVAVVF